MENLDFMNELTKILLEFLRKQAGMVLVLLTVCAGLVWFILEQKQELNMQLMSSKVEYRDEIRSVSMRLDACETARARLVVELEVLKTRVELIGRKK